MSIEERFNTVMIYVSDCCGAYLNEEEAEYEICHECREHCEVISEEIEVETFAQVNQKGRMGVDNDLFFSYDRNVDWIAWSFSHLTHRGIK